MKADSTPANRRNPVRWPFRVLAMLILLTAVFACIGCAYTAWTNGRALLAWQLLASLPGAAWFIRLNWHAAVHARSPAFECWPFASQRVLGCYMLVWMFVLWHPFGG